VEITPMILRLLVTAFKAVGRVYTLLVEELVGSRQRVLSLRLIPYSAMGLTLALV